MECLSKTLHIKGVVQGVGFRPFIYKLPQLYNIKGYVLNDGDGVKIVAEGTKKSYESFQKDISLKLPPFYLSSQICL